MFGRWLLAKPKPRNRSRFFLPVIRRYGGAGLLLCLILLLGSYTASQTRYFLTERNLGNLLLEIAPLALVATGQTAVILIGGIDRSVGPLMSLTTVVASYALVSNNSGGIASGVALCLVVGVIVGALNGLIILRLGIPDLISTFSTFSIVTGLALTVRPSPGARVSDTFADAVTLRVSSVPVIGALAIILGIACDILDLVRIASLDVPTEFLDRGRNGVCFTFDDRFTPAGEPFAGSHLQEKPARGRRCFLSKQYSTTAYSPGSS